VSQLLAPLKHFSHAPLMVFPSWLKVPVKRRLKSKGEKSGDSRVSIHTPSASLIAYRRTTQGLVKVGMTVRDRMAWWFSRRQAGLRRDVWAPESVAVCERSRCAGGGIARDTGSCPARCA
jgi:hypothetical protein